MPLLPKKLIDLDPSDLDLLISDGVAEDEQLEFKRELPTRDGRPDRWYVSQDQIGERARNELLEEIVGFANAYGGDLVLGIGEANVHPARASSRHPVPACEQLAHRLELAARDCIEPPLLRLEVRGVPTGADGEGFVILRTQRSSSGPHRLKPTLQCYRRSGTRTEAMTMRQIQDHTLSTTRRIADLEERFASQRKQFSADMNAARARGVPARLGMRVSAIPEQTDIFLDKVHNVAELQPATRNWILRGERLEEALHYVAQSSTWRLVLRGTELRTSGMPGREAVVRLSSEGAISYQMSMDWRAEEDHRLVLYPGWIMAMLANALESVGKVRSYGGYWGVDYEVEVEIAVFGGNLSVLEFGQMPFTAGEIERPGVVFPRYAFGSDQTVLDGFRPFYVDFWAMLGVEVDAGKLTQLRAA